ncbi:OLC1v1017005C1 [Oldenlandia corymbosa var. corymbosa]|uniref:OLC1v1017005C1 n=1 Tax=Oldenlandia corymbosa var. corymbosa TaxID=529605 RepID=A0AAV1E8M0_OLDCO|nr:OLC1v1017005C1 [Oldenlandia corymbosa var. corymbosa]
MNWAEFDLHLLWSNLQVFGGEIWTSASLGTLNGVRHVVEHPSGPGFEVGMKLPCCFLNSCTTKVYCDEDDDSDTSDTEDSSKHKVRACYLTMSRWKKKEEKEKKKRMKMTQVTMGGVPLQTRSSQPIHVPEYSQDDLEEGDEDEEDEDDVQDSVRMGAHHRDTPMYNLSSCPPPRYSSCPRPGPRGLPSPPIPIPSPMSGEWRSPYHSPSFPHPGKFPQGISTGSQPRPLRPAQASSPYIDPVPPRGGPVSARVSTRPPPLIDPMGPSRGPGSTAVSTRPVTTTASSGGSSQSRVSDKIDPTTWLVTDEVPDHLRQVRERLDRFTELEVKWEPFGPGQQGIVPRTIYSGWIMYRNMQEPYMADRCIRQIGYVQSIPRSPMSPDDAFRGPKTTQYFVQDSAVDTLSTWRRFSESACLNLTRWRYNYNGDIVGECEDRYLEWYRQYSHPFLLPTTDPSAVSTS